MNSRVLRQPPGITSDGWLTENDQLAARTLRLPYSLDEIIAELHESARQVLSEGVTMCAEAGIGAADGVVHGRVVRAVRGHQQQRPDARHRIEHCGLVRPDQLDLIASLGLIPVVQPAFLWASGDNYSEIMGEKRAPWMYRGRSFLHHGITVAGSSDRPVADGSSLRAIEFMVRRRSSRGRAVGPDEAITVEEAIRAYTLGDDPRTSDAIADIPVLATVVGGAFTPPRSS